MKTLADTLGISSPPEASEDQKPEAKLTAKALSRSILQSHEYKQSVMRRILDDKLPAAVECKLYDYAYGKPVDRVEVKDTTERLDELTLEQLEARRVALGAKLRSLQAADEGGPEPSLIH